MRPGKVSENVLKRSILKEIKYTRPEIIRGASISHDCPAVGTSQGEAVVLCVQPNIHAKEDIELLGVNAVANGLTAAGAKPLAAMLTMLLPENVLESDLKQMMRNFHSECEKRHMQIAGGHTEFTNAVNRAVITLTGIGTAKGGSLLSMADCKPGQDIVMSKTIGIEGTYLLALEYKETLEKRFELNYMRKFLEFRNHLSTVNEAAVAVKHGVTAMHDVKDGGIFGALWELSSSAKSGLEVDLKSINVKQETIEICELFGLNPYQLISGGALLMITDDGSGLVKKLNREDITASVIGKIISGNDKLIVNGEEKRFLEPPKKDEIIKMML